MNELTYATLQPEWLERIQNLEQELRSATGQAVVLLAIGNHEDGQSLTSSTLQQ